MFYLYQGLYDFIQSRPGIREFHSTILRFIVGIHSTFFRERQGIRKNPLLRCYAVTRGNEKAQQRYSVTAVFLLSYWGNKKGEHLAMRPRLTFIDGYSD